VPLEGDPKRRMPSKTRGFEGAVARRAGRIVRLLARVPVHGGWVP
jgi:hypothetical protein